MFTNTKPVLNVKVMCMCKRLVVIKGCNSVKRKYFFALRLLDQKRKKCSSVCPSRAELTVMQEESLKQD